MKENRNHSFDLLKAIAIYLVCVYHFGTINYSFTASKTAQVASYFNYFVSGISSIAVPLFFMVNGALLLNKSYDLNKHLRKTISIAVLLLLWSVLTLAIVAVKNGTSYSLDEFITTIYRLKSDGIQHLWFLQAVIYIYLMFPLLKAVYDKNESKLTAYLLVFIFTCTFGIVLLQDLLNVFGYFFNVSSMKKSSIQPFSWLNPFSIYFSYALVYFIMGGWIASDRNSINFRSSIAISLLLLSWMLLFLFGLMKTNASGVWYDTVYQGYNSVMTLVMAICAFYLCLKTIFKNRTFKNALAIIGSNTLGIYLIHVPVGVFLTGYYNKLSLSHYLLCDLLYALLITLLALMITLVIKKIPLIKKLVEL